MPAASGLRIREAAAADLPAVAAIHLACWRSAYRGILSDAILDTATLEARLVLWRQWSREPGVRLSLGERNGAVVGFCRHGPARDVDDPPEGFAEVTHLYVAPADMGGGVGRALFRHALEEARRTGHRGLLLWVLEQNAPARRFYAAHGLAPDGARHDEPAWLGEGVYEVRYRVRFEEPQGIGRQASSESQSRSR